MIKSGENKIVLINHCHREKNLLAGRSEHHEQETKIVIVTGGRGLVGKAIKQVTEDDPRMDETYVFLSSKDANLMSPEETRKIFEQYRPTHVIHLAAKVGGIFDNMKHQLDYLRSNLLINDNVLHNAFQYKVSKVVSCLSTCVFPSNAVYPVDETMIHEGHPDMSHFGYSHAKRLVDVFNKSYHDQHGCQFTSVVLTNIFGPHDNFNLDECNVVPGLIHKGYLAKKEGKPLIVYGSGRPLRQFIYSLDLARLFLWVMREYPEIEPINLCVDETSEVSIRDVAQIVSDAYQLEHGLVFESSKADGAMRRTASPKKLRQYLPDFQFTPLKNAINKTVQWFIENFETARK